MKLKKFFKSKKGNYAILAICVIPVVLSIVATAVSSTRNKTVYRSEITTSISSFFEYENKNNASVSVKKNSEGVEQYYCAYSTNQRKKIEEDFADFFIKIDGYNSLWEYSTISFQTEDGSEYIKFKCTVYIPKLDTLKVIDYWGINDGKYATSDGFYKTHQSTMDVLFKDSSKGNVNEKHWQKIEIEVDSSCV